MTDIINREIKANRYRTDTISGVTKAPVVDGSYVNTRNYRLITRKTTPDYRNRIEFHLRLPVNSYTLSTETVKFPGGYPNLVLTYVPNGDKSSYTGPTLEGFGASTSYLQPSLAEHNASADRCINKALAKMKGQKVNLGNFFAERDQCFKMIAGAATTLARSFSALKRGNLFGAAKILRVPLKPFVSARQKVANQWLALQYGWLPLIADVYGAAEALKAALEPQPPIMSVSATVTTQRDDKIVPMTKAIAKRTYVEVSRCAINYTVETSSSYWLGNLGLTNPASILWEVMPYSFVVDWFLPVGNYLNLLDVELGLAFIDGSSSSRLWSSIEFARDGVETIGYFRYAYSAVGRGDWFNYQRNSMSSMPKARLPQPKNPLGVQHVENALALLTQVFRKRSS